MTPVVDAFPVRVEAPAWAWFRDTWTAPRGQGTRTHHAADIIAPRGSAIVAPVSGTVTGAYDRERGNSGWGVSLLERRDGVTYLWHFAHLEGRAVVSNGQRVRAGDLIGRVGDSGNARTTTPHLHLQVQARRARTDAWVRVNPTAALVDAASRDDARVRYRAEDGRTLVFGGGGPSRAVAAPSRESARRLGAPVWGALVLAAVVLYSAHHE